MPEHTATFWRKGIEYKVCVTGLPVLVAGLKHMRARKIDFLAELSLAKDIEYVVDAGANMGFLSMQYHFAFPNAKILAIEPSSYNLKFLKKNVSGIRNIEVMQAAVARENSDLEIALPTRKQRIDVKLAAEDWDNTGTLSVFGKSTEYREKVRGVKLDDVVEKRVDFLKLDVEGSELEALIGADRILTDDRPIIQIEMRPTNLAMAGTGVHEVHRHILGYGYSRIGKHGGDSIYCHSSIDHNRISEHKLRQTYSSPSELLFDRFKTHLTRDDIAFLRQINKVKRILNIYDVGACIGVLSLLFRAAFGQAVVHAIEPSKANFGHLEHNTVHAGGILIEKVALSNRNGFVKIAMPTIEQRPEMTDESTESSALISVYGESDLYSEIVPVHKLDDHAIGIVDIIKLDAEGHEYEVLEGAERILLNDRPIVFLNLREGTQKMAGRTRLELREKMGSYGYKRVGHHRGDAIYFPEELELPNDVPMEMAI